MMPYRLGDRFLRIGHQSSEFGLRRAAVNGLLCQRQPGGNAGGHIGGIQGSTGIEANDVARGAGFAC